MTVWLGCLWVLAAGLAHALALAWPLGGVAWLGLTPGEPLPWLQWAALVLLALALRRAPTWQQAALWAWCFACAWLAGTFWWIYVSVYTYGGLPAPMAAFSVWALAAFLALYTAAAGVLVWRWRRAGPWRYAAVFAAAWTLAEWARGTLLTGFPWGAAGYAQVDAMAAWAPWIGVYGMGALSAALAAAVAAGAPVIRKPPTQGGRRVLAWWAVPVMGVLLVPMLWPQAGRWVAEQMPSFTQSTGTLPVALLQGNIAQDEKFHPGTGVPLALQWYMSQTGVALRQLDALGGGLVVAPETAIPLLPQDKDPAWWARWLEQIAAGRSAVMIGLVQSYERGEGYTNSVLAWTPALQPYRYDKYHLVPFGEFVPPFFRWFTQWMDVPLGEYNRGALGQPPFVWAGQRLGPNICYEDLFGEELAVAFRDPERAPTILVNVSNIAWFGNTIAIDQHRHISRLRALELQRPMVRSTNTGSTVVIDHLGRVQQELPRWTRGMLVASVEGRQGLTPYARWAARWGQWPLVVLALLVLGLNWRRTR